MTPQRRFNSAFKLLTSTPIAVLNSIPCYPLKWSRLIHTDTSLSIIFYIHNYNLLRCWHPGLQYATAKHSRQPAVATLPTSASTAISPGSPYAVVIQHRCVYCSGCCLWYPVQQMWAAHGLPSAIMPRTRTLLKSQIRGNLRSATSPMYVAERYAGASAEPTPTEILVQGNLTPVLLLRQGQRIGRLKSHRNSIHEGLIIHDAGAEVRTSYQLPAIVAGFLLPLPGGSLGVSKAYTVPLRFSEHAQVMYRRITCHW